MGPQTGRAAGTCWAGTGEMLETMLRFEALCSGKMEPNDTKRIHAMGVHRADTQVPTGVPQKPHVSLLTVQAGLTDGLVDPTGLHNALAKVAGFAALTTRGVHLGQALFLGAPGGSLGEKTTQR